MKAKVFKTLWEGRNNNYATMDLWKEYGSKRFRK